MVIAFVIWSMIGVLFIALGIFSLFSKKAIGFWANAEMFQVTDVGKYNRAICKLFCIFGIIFIMLGSIIFAQEKQSGFLPIMRTAKHGRAKTAVAKILTMLLLTVVFVLMFTFSSFAVYGLRIGFSSPNNVIQALNTFTLSSYQITVGEYFIVTVAVKLLTFAVFQPLKFNFTEDALFPA